MNKLGQFLQDSNHEFSATRLAFLAWIFGALIVWGAGSFHENKIQEVPESVIALIGILMTGKTIQRFGETSSSTDSAGKQMSENGKSSSPSPTGNGTSPLARHME